MRIAIIFDNFGPYHLARLDSLAKHCTLLGIQARPRSLEYGWDNIEVSGFDQATLSGNKNCSAELAAALNGFKPDVVFVPGWGSNIAIAGLIWACERGTPAILMSDSQAIDAPRIASKEWIKRRVAQHASACLVAGRPHRAYAMALGFRDDQIDEGYDVVDNDFFSRESQAARTEGPSVRRDMGLPTSYLLTTARFVEKKNLWRLIEAFGQYRERAGRCANEPSFQNLVILGDGPLRAVIENQVRSLNLQGSIHLLGFRQYRELPSIYGLAEAFILASTTDQWGLSVNEAMASRLPVLVSQNCGCASDLVVYGKNGFTFDPFSIPEIHYCIDKLGGYSFDRRCNMGLESERIASMWSIDKFVSAALHLAAMTIGNTGKKMDWPNKIFFEILRRSL